MVKSIRFCWFYFGKQADKYKKLIKDIFAGKTIALENIPVSVNYLIFRPFNIIYD